MRRAEALAVVAVEELVEGRMVLPLWVVVEPVDAPVDGTASVLIGQEDADQPARQLARHLPQVHLVSRTGGVLDGELVAEVVMEPLERLDHQVVEREPDWAAPVRVAAEQPRVRVARLVVDFETLALK